MKNTPPSFQYVVMQRAIVEAQEKERKHIGEELHDNVSLLLVTARLLINFAKDEPVPERGHLQKAASMLTDAIESIRSFSHTLIPLALHDLGLASSIRSLINNTKAGSLPHFHFLHEFHEHKLSEFVKLTIYRVVQEAVNNIIKHAEAKEVLIELAELDEHIHLKIEDNGKGFCASAVANGVGLSNIQSRIQLVNGQHQLFSAPGKGTRLLAKIPLSAEAGLIY
jgi:two-component system sensor histidine kinase UhpB